MDDLVGVVRRRVELFVAILLIGMLSAAAYILAAEPMFTSTARLVIDTAKIQAFQQQGMSLVGEPQLNALSVDSQVEIIKSEKLARAVIRDLELSSDPEFVDDDEDLLARVLRPLRTLFTSPGKPDLVRRAVSRFSSRLEARRVGATYVISVSFSSRESAKSARIANAVVASYIREQLETKSSTTRQAGKWLEDRLSELRKQAQLADEAVQNFKAENNIVDTSRGLMNEQQLADISTQLILARAHTGEARARFDRVTEILQKDLSDAAFTDALRSDVITRMRQQYLDMARREADWAARMAQDHPALVNLRNELRGTQSAIREELQRIAETYKSELEIAREREAALQRSIAELVRESANTNQHRVVLRDLESRAQTYRTMTDAFLQRYMVAVRQESFPVTDARAITDASPGAKSHPKTLLILAAAMVGSTLVGYGTCLVSDQLDRVFRTASQVEETLGVPCLGLVPRADKSLASRMPASGADLLTGGRIRREPKQILSRRLLLRLVLTTPLSTFAEAIRTIKVGLDLRGLASGKEVLGVTSLLADDGKTTIGTNLAHLAARSGRNVLVVDCDLRRATLSRLMTPNAQSGLLEVLSGEAVLQDVVSRDPDSGLWVLPVVASSQIAHTSLLLSSDAMLQLLQQFRAEYDLVVLDLPPLVPLVDARAISTAVDSFIVVVQWGRSRVDSVKNAFENADALGGKIDGVIINKVDARKVRRYEGLAGAVYGEYGREHLTSAS